MVTSVRYSFTITLKPILYKNKADAQYFETYDKLCNILSQMGKYVLVAETTKAYNIHYHGTMEFNIMRPNLRKYFVDSFRNSKIFGFVNIKQIDDEPGWCEYISKDFEEFRKINLRAIIKDDLDYFDEQYCADYGIEW